MGHKPQKNALNNQARSSMSEGSVWQTSPSPDRVNLREERKDVVRDEVEPQVEH